MQPIDAQAENSGIDENCPSKITRSTFAGQGKVATLDSPSYAMAANGHPALEHSSVSLSMVKFELFRSVGQPCTNQKNQSAILSVTERTKSFAFDHHPGVAEAPRTLPVASICWIQGIDRIGRWTMPQISAPGTSRSIRLANVHAREGRTSERIKTRTFFIWGRASRPKQQSITGESEANGGSIILVGVSVAILWKNRKENDS